MNFLDPGHWDDLDALEKQYTDLNEELVKQLHEKLRPYFLRRIKSEVLDMPPKVGAASPCSTMS
jgi:chromodomain-helicase-DNA-binding protein 4